MTAVDSPARNDAATVPIPVGRPRQRHQSVDYGVALVAVAVLTGFTDQWAAQLLIVPLVLAVPGLLLLRALRIDGSSVARAPHLVISASLVVLLFVGLATNLMGPILGVEKPLAHIPVLTCFEIVNIALLAASWKASVSADIEWFRLRGRADLLVPIALPVLAVIGAFLLENAQSDVMARAFLVAVILVLLAAIALADRIDDALVASIIGCVCIGLMWSYSLHGPSVYGFDIAVEYRDAANTIGAGTWPLVHIADAYGAMASVTTFPAALSAMTGMTAATLFKVIYPVIFAAFPIGMFFLARTVLVRRWALIATVVLLAQRNLSQQMPGLARQEIALAVFIGLLTVICVPSVRSWRKSVLIGFFAVATVLSHYSTAYMSIALFGIGLAFMAFFWIWRLPPMDVAVAALWALFSLCVGAFLWYGVATQSAANVGEFITKVQQNGLDPLPNQKAGASLLANFLNSNSVGSATAQQYQDMVAEKYAETPYIHPYPEAFDPRYALEDDAISSPPPTVDLLGYISLASQQLIYPLAAVGGALLILLRRDSTSNRAFGYLAFAAMAVLVVLRLSGTVANSYNQDRALLQEMPVLLVCAGWSLQEFDRFIRQKMRSATLGQWLPALLYATGSVTAGLTLAVATSLLPSSVAPGSNVTTSGEAFERYSIDQQELDAASWLGYTAPKSAIVSMDRYAQLRYLAMTGRVQGMLLDVAPAALDQRAWIYASTVNMTIGRARGQINNNLVTYKFPIEFLDDHFDLVYSNGRSAVFH